MPYSEKQRKLAYMALEHPEKIKRKNKSILGAGRDELMDIAHGPMKKKKSAMSR